MSEQTVETPAQVSEEQKQQVSPFSSNAWSDTPPKANEKPNIEGAAEVAIDSKEKPPTSTIANDDDEIVEPKEWLKREFEIDDPEILKQQIKEYKELKEKPPVQEYKFENDESKQLAEAISKGDRKTVLKILETQDKLENYLSGEVTKESADDIIKLGMKLKFKDLSDHEINYKFNKQYSIPKEPVIKDDETEPEFEARKNEWLETVNDIQMSKIIDAKVLKPELEKAKVEIKLPELSKPQEQQEQPSQESLEAAAKARNNFLQRLESDYSKVEGFTTKVKNESVEIPISFKIPDEDKAAIKERLGGDGINVQEYMLQRWFDAEGNPKIDLIFSDIYELENRDKVHSGIANNAANKMLEHHLKNQKNPDLNGETPQQTYQATSTTNVSPFSKDAWSEKPPALINN